jgi:predicted nucleic acid-binding protein
MKIFVDTNVFLDLLLSRERAAEAETLLNAVEAGLHEGVVLDISLVNIDYVAAKQGVDARAFLSLVVRHFRVVGIDNALAAEALEAASRDFEDAMQLVAARSQSCEVIVTNDKGFDAEGMVCCSSAEFLA